MHRQHARLPTDQPDRGEVLARIVSGIGIERRIDTERAGIGEQDGVAIGRALGDGSRRDRATSAAAVLHHDLLAERAGHLLGNDTRQRIVAATGGKRHHQRDRTRGIILRPDRQRAGENRCERRNRDRCRSRTGAQQSDGRKLGSLLRERRERPRSRAAEQRDELASFHSMTSSARASTLSGNARPSVLAVLTLIVSSYLIGCCTGNSATFAPLRIRSTYDAARLYESSTSDA